MALLPPDASLTGLWWRNMLGRLHSASNLTQSSEEPPGISAGLSPSLTCPAGLCALPTVETRVLAALAAVEAARGEGPPLQQACSLLAMSQQLQRLSIDHNSIQAAFEALGDIWGRMREDKTAQKEVSFRPQALAGLWEHKEGCACAVNQQANGRVCHLHQNRVPLLVIHVDPGGKISIEATWAAIFQPELSIDQLQREPRGLSAKATSTYRTSCSELPVQRIAFSQPEGVVLGDFQGCFRPCVCRALKTPKCSSVYGHLWDLLSMGCLGRDGISFSQMRKPRPRAALLRKTLSFGFFFTGLSSALHPEPSGRPDAFLSALLPYSAIASPRRL